MPSDARESLASRVANSSLKPRLGEIRRYRQREPRAAPRSSHRRPRDIDSPWIRATASMNASIRASRRRLEAMHRDASVGGRERLAVPSRDRADVVTACRASRQRERRTLEERFIGRPPHPAAVQTAVPSTSRRAHSHARRLVCLAPCRGRRAPARRAPRPSHATPASRGPAAVRASARARAQQPSRPRPTSRATMVPTDAGVRCVVAARAATLARDRDHRAAPPGRHDRPRRRGLRICERERSEHRGVARRRHHAERDAGLRIVAPIGGQTEIRLTEGRELGCDTRELGVGSTGGGAGGGLVVFVSHASPNSSRGLSP